MNKVKLEIYNLAVWYNYDTKAINSVLRDKKGTVWTKEMKWNQLKIS